MDVIRSKQSTPKVDKDKVSKSTSFTNVEPVKIKSIIELRREFFSFLGHLMKKVNFEVPTWCIFANKFIWGLDKTGYECKGIRYSFSLHNINFFRLWLNMFSSIYYTRKKNSL
jgi:hypothetical protein